MRKRIVAVDDDQSTLNLIQHFLEGYHDEYEVVTNAIRILGVSSKDGQTADTDELNIRLAKLCFGFGYEHFWHGDIRKARKAFLLSIRHRKYQFKQLIYYLLSWVSVKF